MNVPVDHDLIVIGAGSGGLAASLRAARLGARVALLDPAAVGGTCVNRGCVPKKVMWAAAQMMSGSAQARAFGLVVPAMPALDFAALCAARDAYIDRIHASYARQFAETGVVLLPHRGQLLAPGQVQLDDGRVLSARHVLIATGGRPVQAAFPGAQWLQTSDDFFQWRQLPERVAVIGGGYIGVELACLLNTLGSEVSLLVRGQQLLQGFDGELTTALAERMLADGIDLRFGAAVTAIEGAPGALQLQGQGRLPGQAFTAVVSALGRQPNVEGLGLERLGLSQDRRGFIVTEEQTLATSVPSVWAVGDVTGQPSLTPVAVAQGRRLAEQLFGEASLPAVDMQNVASVVFAHPPLGRVGLTEEQARVHHAQVRVYRSRFKPMVSSVARQSHHSHVKVVCAGTEERIVGVHLFGDQSDEMLQGFAVAIQAGATLSHLRQTIPIHPTLSEEVVLVR